MFWPFKKKKVVDHLNDTRKLKIHHMDFIIKIINVLDHCTGAKVCSAIFSTYQLVSDQKNIEDINFKKVKDHYIDVLMAGIVSPEFSRKEKEDGKIFIGNLLTDWDLAQNLYGEIMAFSYGKKNFKQLISLGKK
jgi:hypothetical protein